MGIVGEYSPALPLASVFPPQQGAMGPWAKPQRWVAMEIGSSGDRSAPGQPGSRATPPDGPPPHLGSSRLVGPFTGFYRLFRTFL